MISKKLLVAVATAVATFAATLTFASPAGAAPPDGQGWFRLANWYEWGCLAVQGSDYHAEAFTTTCGEYNDQFFRFERIGSSEYFRIRKFNSPLCLYANGTDTGAAIRQYPCATYLDQQFIPILRYDFTSSDDLYQLKNRNSGKCIFGAHQSRAVFQVGCASELQDWTDQFWMVMYT